MKFKSLIVFLLLFSGQLAAEELFIRNRAFTGPVSGFGDTRYVEAKSFAEAIGVPIQQFGTTLFLGASDSSDEAEASVHLVKVNGQSVPFERSETGEYMILLAPSVKALGGRLVSDKTLGTVDVYLDREARERLETSSKPPEQESPVSNSSPSSQNSSSSSVVGAGGQTFLRPSQDPETGLWGFRSGHTGPFTVAAQFARARPFSNGRAAVCQDKGLSKKVKKDNTFTIVGKTKSGASVPVKRSELSAKQRSEYDRLKREQSRTAKRTTSYKRIEGKWGFVDTRGRLVVDQAYNEVGNFAPKRIGGQKHIAALVRQGSKKFWIDRNGNKIADAQRGDKIGRGGHTKSKSASPLLTLTAVPPNPTVRLKVGGGQRAGFAVRANTQSWSFEADCPKLKKNRNITYSPGSGATTGQIRFKFEAYPKAKPGTYYAPFTVSTRDGASVTVDLTIIVEP